MLSSGTIQETIHVSLIERRLNGDKNDKGVMTCRSGSKLPYHKNVFNTLLVVLIELRSDWIYLLCCFA